MKKMIFAVLLVGLLASACAPTATPQPAPVAPPTQTAVIEIQTQLVTAEPTKTPILAATLPALPSATADPMQETGLSALENAGNAQEQLEMNIRSTHVLVPYLELAPLLKTEVEADPAAARIEIIECWKGFTPTDVHDFFTTGYISENFSILLLTGDVSSWGFEQMNWEANFPNDLVGLCLTEKIPYGAFSLPTETLTP